MITSRLPTTWTRRALCVKRLTSRSLSTQSKQTPLSVLFFGSDDFSLATLQALSKSPTLVSHLEIVCPPDPVVQRGGVVRANMMKHGESFGRVHQLQQGTDFRMSNWQVPQSSKQPFDIGVVVSFGYFLPRRVIESFPLGMLNLHGSLLPKFRGASPIQHALMAGERETGVSIIEVDPTGIDIGGILDQASMPLTPDSRFREVHQTMAKLGSERMLHTLRNLDELRRSARTQAVTSSAKRTNDSNAKLYSAPKLNRNAGRVDWTNHDARTVYNRFRGLDGFMDVTTWMRKFGSKHRDDAGRKVFITEMADYSRMPHEHMRSTPSKLQPGEVAFDWRNSVLVVRCGGLQGGSATEPNAVAIRKLKVMPKATKMDAKSFAHGHLWNLDTERVVFGAFPEQVH